jgi:hypothetical protein
MNLGMQLAAYACIYIAEVIIAVVIVAAVFVAAVHTCGIDGDCLCV